MSPACYALPAKDAVFTDQFNSDSVQIEGGGVERTLQVKSVSGGRSISESSTMGTVPVSLAEYLTDRFSAIDNVRALMVGESDDIHHVWVLLDEWTSEHRKAIYAVQRDILRRMSGFNLDFYVVDIPAGTSPREMVSGIPIVYQRA